MKTLLVLLMMSAATLERISQMPQWDNAAAEMEHPKKVLSVSFVSDY